MKPEERRGHVCRNLSAVPIPNAPDGLPPMPEITKATTGFTLPLAPKPSSCSTSLACLPASSGLGTQDPVLDSSRSGSPEAIREPGVPYIMSGTKFGMGTQSTGNFHKCPTAHHR
ncbi:hypothetical protein Micbo1qcDRAFT_156307, partial [Microdochium bolleyi]